MGRLRTAAVAVAMGAVCLGNVAQASAQTHDILTPSITAVPALSPAFNLSTTNYVTKCTTGTVPNTVTVDVHARGHMVSVDSSTPQRGIFDENLALTPGQGFTITIGTGASATDYYVRCLPPDFPGYASTVLGPRQTSFVLAAPNSGAAGTNPYIVMFDNNGVPVWWYKVTDGGALDADIDPDGNLSWAVNAPGGWPYFGTPGNVNVEVHSLDGTLVNKLTTNGTAADFHEAWPLANGDFLIDTYVPEFNVPVSIPGEPATVNVLDGGFQEVAPDGSTVYSWLSAGHINPNDSVNYEWMEVPYPGLTGDLWDWQHINAVMPYESGYLVSFRDTGAVYYIDAATGDVVWKLGGTDDPGESLQVLPDPSDPSLPTAFYSQHDVRVWPDGTISIFDNGTRVAQQPRMMRFSINAAAGTATLVQSITFSKVPFSAFVGSARAIEPDDLTDSDWLIDWGGTPWITEMSPTGTPELEIRLHEGITYRAVPITTQLTLAQIQAGMASMYGAPASLASNGPRR